MKHMSAYRHVVLLWYLISSQLVCPFNAEWTQKEHIPIVCGMPVILVPIMISLIYGCCSQRNYYTKGYYCLWHFESCQSPKLPGWVICNICVTNDDEFYSLFVHTSRFFPHSWHHRDLNRLTRCVWLEEQEQIALSDHLGSPLGFSGFVLPYV